MCNKGIVGLYCLCLLIFGCTKPSSNLLAVESSIAYETEILELEEIPMPLRFSTYSKPIMFRDKEYLGRINHFTNTLDIFDLANGDFWKRVPEIDTGEMFLSLREEPKIKGFVQISPNEILLLNEYFLGKNLIYNMETGTTRTRSFTNKAVRAIVYLTNPVVQIGNKLFYTPDPLYEPNEGIADEWLNWEAALNIMEGSTEGFDIRLPAIYQGAVVCPSMIIPSRCLGKNNNLVYSFPLTDSVVAVGLGGKNRAYYIENKMFSVGAGKKNFGSLQECHIKYATTALWESIYYDPYRSLYYRFFSLPNGNKNSVYDKNGGFVVLSEDFNPLGWFEIRYPEFGQEIFVAKEGLFISREQTNAPAGNDNVKFLIIKFAT